MTPPNCPYCHAPLPAPKPGTTWPVSLCQVCGRAVVTVAPVAGGVGADKRASSAKTMMWTGGLGSGMPARSDVPPVAAPSRTRALATDKPVPPGSAASPSVAAPGDAKPAAPQVPALARPVVSPAAASPRGHSAVPDRASAGAAEPRTATSEFAMAPTVAPPPPEPAGVAARPERAAFDVSGPDPGSADVDLNMLFDSGTAPRRGAAAAAGPLSAEPTSKADAASAPENGPLAEGANGGPRKADASGAVPEWAGSPLSVGLAASLTGAPGRGRRHLLLAAGGVGVLVLVAVGVAVIAGGGRKQSAPDQRRAPMRAVVGTEKAAAPAQPATGEKLALPAAAVEPAKPQPVGEEKPQVPAKSEPAAAEKVAVPAKKTAQPEKSVSAPLPASEKPWPVGRKVAAEKPAPPEHPAVHGPGDAFKPAVDRPVTQKVRTASEPAVPRQEKKQTDVATSGAKLATNKPQEAAEAFQRGNAKLLSGATAEAIAAFSEALQLNPKDAQSRRGLGLAYAQAGSAAPAVRHLKLYLKASPNAPDRALIDKRIDQLGGR